MWRPPPKCSATLFYCNLVYFSISLFSSSVMRCDVIGIAVSNFHSVLQWILLFVDCSAWPCDVTYWDKTTSQNKQYNIKSVFPNVWYPSHLHAFIRLSLSTVCNVRRYADTKISHAVDDWWLASVVPVEVVSGPRSRKRSITVLTSSHR